MILSERHGYTAEDYSPTLTQDALRAQLIAKAHEVLSNTDPAHDVLHALRVLGLVERIAAKEGGDLEVLMPAALFHDWIVRAKNHPDTHLDQQQSADQAAAYLNTIAFPADKIEVVYDCIRYCSFSRGGQPQTLEQSILRDADMLECTGAVGIMRTFSSTTLMRNPYYHAEDPFALNREQDSKQYSIDLFGRRLLKIESTMFTQTGKQLARERTPFLWGFLEQLASELDLPSPVANYSIG